MSVFPTVAPASASDRHRMKEKNLEGIVKLIIIRHDVDNAINYTQLSFLFSQSPQAYAGKSLFHSSGAFSA